MLKKQTFLVLSHLKMLPKDDDSSLPRQLLRPLLFGLNLVNKIGDCSFRDQPVSVGISLYFPWGHKLGSHGQDGGIRFVDSAGSGFHDHHLHPHDDLK